VEALSAALHTTTIQPGRAHDEFCQMPFDRLVTTNWDFLLEESYARLNRYCMPLLSEDQLALAHAQTSVKLLKLHGDLHHPGRMVITEDDYDAFLGNYPLLATHLS
jgi:SIR2-like domain